MPPEAAWIHPWRLTFWTCPPWRWMVQIMFLSKWVMAVGEPAVNLPGCKYQQKWVLFQNPRSKNCYFKSLRIHGAGIFTYIYHRNQPNVGKYTIHGSLGSWLRIFFFPEFVSVLFLRKNRGVFATLEVPRGPSVQSVSLLLARTEATMVSHAGRCGDF